MGFNSGATTRDTISIKVVRAIRDAYIVETDFHKVMESSPVVIYPSEEVARKYVGDAKMVKVSVKLV